jgi:hypothetical protein
VSLERIDPIRIVAPRPIDRIVRERRHGERGGQRDPKEEQEAKEEPREPDDGLPHIDVRG